MGFEDSVQGHLCRELCFDGWDEQSLDQIRIRAEKGKETYGTYLQVGNPGRDGVQDLREELLDALVYAHERWLATGDHRFLDVRCNVEYCLEMLKD